MSYGSYPPVVWQEAVLWVFLMLVMAGELPYNDFTEGYRSDILVSYWRGALYVTYVLLYNAQYNSIMHNACVPHA